MVTIKCVLPATAMLCTAMLTASVQAEETAIHAQHDHAESNAESSAEAKQDDAAVKAYRQANAHMHQAMTARYSGNADVDFARGMIPHHQGAIAMAKVELKYGTDPQMRILAEQIINDQQAEIATLKSWLEKHRRSVKP